MDPVLENLWSLLLLPKLSCGNSDRAARRSSSIIQSVKDARTLAKDLVYSIETLSPLAKPSWGSDEVSVSSPIVKVIQEAGHCCITVRQAGDQSLLLDFGEEDGFTIRQTFHMINFIDKHHATPIAAIQELTRGVRSLHVRFEANVFLSVLLDALLEQKLCLGTEIQSRLHSRAIHMSLAFDDEMSRKAIHRYASTIRPTAPYLPSNVDSLQQLNGFDSRDQVGPNLFEARFLVLGLGDVYQGSPCEVSLDPRHRLFGTKYNSSRSFTPGGTVGIAGQYFCIYATDSSGGYQLVGRTVPIWNEVPKAQSKEEAPNPWFFSLLNQVTSFPVTEEDLAAVEEKGKHRDLVKMTHTDLDLNEYEQWLSSNAESVCAVHEKRFKAAHGTDFLDHLVKPYEAAAVAAAMRATRRVSESAVTRTMLPICCRDGGLGLKGDPLVGSEPPKLSSDIN